MVRSIFISITVILGLGYIFLFYLFMSMWRFSKKADNIFYLYHEYVNISRFAYEDEYLNSIQEKIDLKIQEALREYERIPKNLKKFCEEYKNDLIKIGKKIHEVEG